MSTETIADVDTAASRANEYLHRLAGTTILVAGAGGYLGTALLSSLHSISCRIVALVRDRKRVAAPASKATLQVLHADLAEPSIWFDVLRDTKPDVIVNLAAHEHRRDSPHSPPLDIAVNTATVLDLLEACCDLNLKPRIILASSANIAGCSDAPLVNEDTPDRPLTLYAINKLAAEYYLRYYATRFNIPAVALRFANVYGPLPTRDPEIESRVVLNSIIRRALAGGPLYLYRNQNCVRDFVYIGDVVRAIAAAASSDTITPGSKYIVGSGEGHSLKEIVNEVARQAEHLRREPIEVRVDDSATLEPIEWRNFVADYTRLRAATGWEPHVKLHEGIDSTLRAFIGGQPQ